MKKKLGKDLNAIEGVKQLSILYEEEGLQDQDIYKILITTAVDIDDKVREYASKYDIIVIDGNQFSRLLIKYGVKVNI